MLINPLEGVDGAVVCQVRHGFFFQKLVVQLSRCRHHLVEEVGHAVVLVVPLDVSEGDLYIHFSQFLQLHINVKIIG